MKIQNDNPDILYFVKEDEDNEELRYSLRSLKNIQHNHVFIAGYLPSWVEHSVLHINVAQTGLKYENVNSIWTTALNDSRLGDTFILMNDDFFIMKPMKRLPVLRRLKNIDHYIDLFEKVPGHDIYVNKMRETKRLLCSWGITDISSYDLHVPMEFNRQKLNALRDKIPPSTGVQIRTLYGNYYNLGGRRIKDVKVIDGRNKIPYTSRFISTTDNHFLNHPIGRYIKREFS